MTSIIL